MNRMVPLAALDNWNYRPRFGFESGTGQCQKEKYTDLSFLGPPKNWAVILFLVFATIPLSIWFLPWFLRTKAAKLIFGIIFVLVAIAATLYFGPIIWIVYLGFLILLYPIFNLHQKQDPVYKEIKFPLAPEPPAYEEAIKEI